MYRVQLQALSVSETQNGITAELILTRRYPIHKSLLTVYALLAYKVI